MVSPALSPVPPVRPASAGRLVRNPLACSLLVGPTRSRVSAARGSAGGSAQPDDGSDGGSVDEVHPDATGGTAGIDDVGSSDAASGDGEHGDGDREGRDAVADRARHGAGSPPRVSRWQRDRGWPPTGVVDADQIVFATSAVRVAELKASLGTAAIGAVLTYTGIEKVVTMAVPLARRQLVQTGTTVTVILPDGAAVAGTVAAVDATTVTGGGTDTSTSGRGQGTVRAIVRVSDQAGLAGLESAPVGVQLVVGTAEDVLAVPVSALVALAEGGYGIEVVSPAGSQYLAVKPGMFANGLVEISGDGISAGMRVGVPAE
jgi:hypothetical protein